MTGVLDASRAAAIAAFVLAALAFSAPAFAKGKLTEIKLCGASECATFTDERTLRGATGGGEPFRGVPPASPYYSLEFTHGTGRLAIAWRAYYVPEARLMRNATMGDWWTLTPASVRTLARMTRPIEPFPRPELTTVRVGAQIVREGASSYLGLLDFRAKADIPFSNDARDVRFESARPSPWTDGGDLIVYFPRENVVQRETEWFRVPADVAAAVERGDPLDGGSRDRTSLAWAASLLLVVAGAAVALVARRVRSTRGTSPAYET